MHTGEIFDLFADYRDTTLVGGVELENSGLDHFGAVKLFGEGQNCGCLAGSRGPIEKHMWQLLGDVSLVVVRAGSWVRTLEACRVLWRTVTV